MVLVATGLSFHLSVFRLPSRPSQASVSFGRPHDTRKHEDATDPADKREGWQ